MLASASEPRISASSPVAISQGTVRRSRTCCTNLTANDPANATFIVCPSRCGPRYVLRRLRRFCHWVGPVVAYVEKSQGPSFLIDNRNIFQAPRLHAHPDIVRYCAGVNELVLPKRMSCGLVYFPFYFSRWKSHILVPGIARPHLLSSRTLERPVWSTARTLGGRA
jgi:hypothetical protein